MVEYLTELLKMIEFWTCGVRAKNLANITNSGQNFSPRYITNLIVLKGKVIKPRKLKLLSLGTIR